MEIRSLPFGMVIEQGFDQHFRQREFARDGRQLSLIERSEERGQYRSKDRIPLKRVDEDIGIEIDTSGQG